MRQESDVMDGMSFQPDETLDFTTATHGEAPACATLTPAIRAKLREMAPGQVLEVRIADPTAREDLESWCRMSGNDLLAAREESPGVLQAWLRKKDG